MLEPSAIQHDRRALVIVVPECATDASLDLPIVRNDAQALALSLQQSAYSVTLLGANEAHAVSRGTIRTQIRKACEEIDRDGTLLIFLSGHGVHVSGKNYIIPYDGDLKDASEHALFSIDYVLEAADSSRAREIIVFVDACREGMEEYTKGTRLRRIGSEKLKSLSRRNFAIIYSCQPGQLSYYVPGVNGFSVFSKAFSRALSRDNPARTLQQVFDAAQEFANDLSKDIDRPQQVFRLISDRSSDIMSTIICEGYSTEGSRLSEKSWYDAVMLSPLWMFTVDSVREEPRGIAGFRDYCASIARIAEHAFSQSTEALPGDVWRDRQYPIRVLGQLDRLIHSNAVLDLTVPEVALLIAAPFVRECAYSSAVSALIRAFPHSPDSPSEGISALSDAEHRRRLTTTFLAYPQVMRRIASLNVTKTGRRGKVGPDLDVRAIVVWLMHRHVAKFAAMWQAPPQGTLCDFLPSGDVEIADDVSAVFDRQRLIKLAKCVRCEAARLRRASSEEHGVEGEGSLDELSGYIEDMVAPRLGDQPIRERMVASLLSLAGWLALDPRLADIVLIDHIGVADSIDIENLRTAVRAAQWEPLWGAWRLNVSCSHPAIDFALRELVGHADRVLGEVRLLLGADATYARLLGALPTRLLTDGIQPREFNGAPAYTTPHRTFSLANHEIRELLMGEQLYGDPDLALRELYQNALDACRYRRARIRYLSQTGRPQNWSGRIIFRQGAVNGRAYVECEDNGVGMSVHELEDCFARAGRRFTDLPEFIEEQELWLQCNPSIEFYANSQFGVGVLSYFMIADEIEISTCRFQRDGRLGVPLEVSIPGSGNLFRVRPGPRPSDSGTRIRLYLREDWKRACTDVLTDFLVVAEFETEAHYRRKRVRWKPGQPRDEDRFLRTDNPDFWWDSQVGGGEVLADGIRIQADIRSNKKGIRSGPFIGILVNFRGSNRPRLTVDRKSILDYNISWVEEVCVSEVNHLLDSSWVRFTWLWNISEPPRRIVYDALCRRDSFVPIGYEDEFNKSFIHNISTRYESALKLVLWNESVSTMGFPVKDIGIEKEHIKSRLALSASLHITSLDEMYNMLDRILDVRSPLPQSEGSHVISFEERLSALRFDKDYRNVQAAKGAARFATASFPHGDWIKAYLPEGSSGIRAAVALRLFRRPVSRARILYHALIIRLGGGLLAAGLFIVALATIIVVCLAILLH